MMDGGAQMRELIAEMRSVEQQLGEAPGDDTALIRGAFGTGIDALQAATDWCVENLGSDLEAVMAAAVNYMMLAGYVCGGWQMARAAMAAQGKLATGEDPAFHEAKLVTARFYAEQILPKAGALLSAVTSGATTIMALEEEQF
jgi:hypothetical protein